MSEQLIQGIVRILDGNRDIAGTGFVISESGLIATCSHVIQHEALQERGSPKPEKVTIVFHATGDEQDARVEPQWWLPWNAGDLAIIRVEGILPQGVQPLSLGSAEGTNGHEVSAFGFPNVDDIEGIGADGRVVRVLLTAGRFLLQLRSSEITTGFSGAPIWDTLGRRVIGMVSAITEPDRHHRLTETAFAIATETLRDVCPVLQLSEVCPYRGLAAFTEADSEFFFGRQQIVDGLLHRLRRDLRFLTVLGPSGSGKSSVVQAGLIPHVRSGKVPDSERWGIIVFRPAAQPFDELSKQGLIDEPYDLTENIQVWMGQHTEQERLMLVVDQFEELFSMCPEAIRQAFITQVVKLLHSPLPITLVLVIRDDFYSRLTQQETLVEWIEQSQGPIHVLKFLKQDELKAIIQKPIEAVGLRCEEGLVEMIVKDTMETSVASEDGGQIGRSAILPLLEFALTELWKLRQKGMLTHEAYHRIGGVAGALIQWADQAFYALKQEERRLAQRILTDLVYIGDESQGVLDSRRHRTIISLCRSESEQESIQRVVQHLVEKRLLATDRDLQSNKETVEIIHDILLREWGKLQEWLKEDRLFLTWHQELERLAHGWAVQRGRNKLLRGRDLTEAKRWLKGRGADLSQDEVAFIRASIVHYKRFAALMITFVLLLASTLGAAAWLGVHQPPDPTYVTSLRDSGTGSLRWAIANASSGSTITFDSSLKGKTILLASNDIHIFQQHLTIRGLGEETLAISSGHNGATVIVDPGATVTISDLSFRDSVSRSSFVSNSGTLTIINSTISNNKTLSNNPESFDNGGGGISNSGTLKLINSTVSDNSIPAKAVDGNGGGIWSDGTLTIINSMILHNMTASDVSSTASTGGGIDASGTVTILNSTISNNQTLDGDGGGIDVDGMLTITNSTISHNKAFGSGGGIWILGTLKLTNSTISDNSADTGNLPSDDNSLVGFISGSGGGLYFEEPVGGQGSANITFCTIYGNKASGNGGGVDHDISMQAQFNPDDMVLRNSIVAKNYAHQMYSDIEGPIISGGYNLIQDNSNLIFDDPYKLHATDIPGNQYLDLKIDPVLRLNGGPTETLALLSGSPAIDAIPLKACLINILHTDQRGVRRPQGRACDIGAYEAQSQYS